MTVRFATLFAAVLLIAADDPAKDTRKDMDALQGEWTMVSMEIRGRKNSSDAVKQYKLTIKDDQWIVTSKGQEGRMTFKIDPSKDPKTIDMTSKNADKEDASLGIYKLEGDTLTLCRTSGSGERPKEFKTTADVGILVVWKHEKK